MTSSSAGPDVSVRVAWADDAEAVAGVQVAAWSQRYEGTVPAEVLPDAASVAETWRGSLARPTDARQRLLVALERNRVVGFAVTTPAGDPDCDPIVDGEVSEVTVLPTETGRGHGSRLLQAAADTLRADRFTRAVTWLLADDDALREFLVSAGWAPDGAHRALDLDGTGQVTVKQVRLHTALVD